MRALPHRGADAISPSVVDQDHAVRAGDARRARHARLVGVDEDDDLALRGAYSGSAAPPQQRSTLPPPPPPPPGAAPLWTAQPAAASAIANAIHADPATNSIIINAPDAIYNDLRAAVEKLDVRRAQVYVEALVAEVTAQKAAEFGIQWQDLTGAGALDGSSPSMSKLK